MNVVICSSQEQVMAEVGIPAHHALGMAESTMQTWVHRAEYRLPEGYTVSKNRFGKMGVYNSLGHHCPVIDNAYTGGRGGKPVLIDPDRPEGEQVITLTKLYDRTLEILRRRTK